MLAFLILFLSFCIRQGLYRKRNDFLFQRWLMDFRNISILKIEFSKVFKPDKNQSGGNIIIIMFLSVYCTWLCVLKHLFSRQSGTLWKSSWSKMQGIAVLFCLSADPVRVNILLHFYSYYSEGFMNYYLAQKLKVTHNVSGSLYLRYWSHTSKRSYWQPAVSAAPGPGTSWLSYNTPPGLPVIPPASTIRHSAGAQDLTPSAVWSNWAAVWRLGIRARLRIG